MIVVGGTYFEECEFPRSEELWGPGLRGISAIQNITSGENTLYTCIGSSEEIQLKLKAGSYNFSFELTDIPETIRFQYLHNHSNAKLQPSEASHYNVDIGSIDGEAILRFGLVEGTAVVDGARVVYDPQSIDEEPFHRNGSHADELALVLNKHEASQYTGKDSVDEMLDALTTGANSADIAVIKCGAAGAVLQQNDQKHEIPVYNTESVWNIGSGDVFSSTFAAYWAESGYPAIEAAEKASLATAYYCSRRQLPIPEEPRQIDAFDPEQKPPTVGETGPTVYLAAPFFSIGEFWLVNEVRRILFDEGAQVISPFHDIGRIEDYDTPEEVAEKDLDAMGEADVVLALIDNCDSGTFFETGHARGIDKPVIAYGNDLKDDHYTMLEGTGCELYEDLATAVFKAMWAK
jgi:hypothetical protein